jgi:sugar phosphate isomerase/epimerase
MYFAMDYIGVENVRAIKEIHDQSEKWRFIYNLASGFGFTGIQLFPAYESQFGLSFQSVPEFIRKSFRLTYHVGNLKDIAQLVTPDEVTKADTVLSNSLRLATLLGVEDVSIHPPVVDDISLLPLPPEQASPERNRRSIEQLRRLLTVWLHRFQSGGITLSIETHMTPYVFVFSGLLDFREFVLSVPGLGVLVDVSHNHYDGNDIADVLLSLEKMRITGFHLSDAVRGRKLSDGTHLPIGEGQVDFVSVTRLFGNNNNVYGALEVRGPEKGITGSLARLKSISSTLQEGKTL